jgi:hypothetical protein
MIKSKARKFISHTIIAVLVLIMSGCGGGNSNSGGSSNTFIGTQEVSISQSRITSNSRTTDFELSRGENQITISDRDFTITAQLSGSSFTVTSPSIPILNPQPGSGCSSFSVTYSGTITDSMVVGTISGATDCLLSASISGSFEASNQTNSMLAAVASIASIVVL